MSFAYEIDGEDEALLARLRVVLRGRREELGVTAKDLSLRLGRHEEFVTSLEVARTRSPLLSSLQVWAGGLGLRMEFGLEGFWLYSWPAGGEMMGLYALSRPWGADVWGRLWLVSALAVLRKRRGVSADELGVVLGCGRGGVLRWEGEAADPLLARVQLQARAVGSRLGWMLFEEDEWVYS